MEEDGFLCSFNKEVRGSFLPGSENTEVRIVPALPSCSVLCAGTMFRTSWEGGRTFTSCVTLGK